MRVLVCGGRDYKDEYLVYKTLDAVLAKYGDDLVIIHGSAPGADELAEKWAKSRQVEYIGIPAKWKAKGRGAGPIRNKLMRDKYAPKACIAFPGENGTKGMVGLMREIGIEPWLVGWDE